MCVCVCSVQIAPANASMKWRVWTKIAWSPNSKEREKATVNRFTYYHSITHFNWHKLYRQSHIRWLSSSLCPIIIIIRRKLKINCIANGKHETDAFQIDEKSFIDNTVSKKWAYGIGATFAVVLHSNAHD